MPIKKLLKIIGLSVLSLFIFFFGLTIVLSSLNQGTGGNMSENLAIGSAGSFDSFGGITPTGAVSKMSSREIVMDSVMTVTQVPTASSVTQPVDKKIIKTGDLSLKIEKIETAVESITNIVKLNKGEIFNSYFSESSRGTKSGYITIRVPYQNFTTVFNEVKKVATQVMSESSNAQDITEQYIDLEARLKNKQAEEVSFVALLNRSGKIEEILAVTREVARVRGEIEQLQGQMKYLNSQTDMSTITVNLSEDVVIASASQDWRPWQVVKLSVKQLITAGQGFIDGLIRFIIVALPMLLIYVFILWLIYFVGKKIYHKFKKPGQF